MQRNAQRLITDDPPHRRQKALRFRRAGARPCRPRMVRSNHLTQNAPLSCRAYRDEIRSCHPIIVSLQTHPLASRQSQMNLHLRKRFRASYHGRTLLDGMRPATAHRWARDSGAWWKTSGRGKPLPYGEGCISEIVGTGLAPSAAQSPRSGWCQCHRME